MLNRCTNPNAHEYRQYGAAGITVCDEWRSFERFLADMGERPADTSIDRIDVNKGYFPGNCRWASRLTQQNNRKCNRHVTIGGRRQTAAEWGREVGVSPRTLLYRIEKGWPVEAILGPPEPNKRRNFIPA